MKSLTGLAEITVPVRGSPPRIFSIGRPECLDFIEVSEALKSLKVRTFKRFELFCFLISFMLIFV